MNNNNNSFAHIPVFLHEAVDALRVLPDGTYFDCTAGGGGHSSLIAQGLSESGQLVAIDRDPQAIEVLHKKFDGHTNIQIVRDNFHNLSEIAASLSIGGAHGILADLGVSSHQLDCTERGFSYHGDAPLDMRMSMSGASAAELVNTLSFEELRRIIYSYGEEKFAPSIAGAIVRERERKPFETTGELAEAVKSAIPAAARREGGHPARRTFQALRIEVNGELEFLEESLRAMFNLLLPGGRVAIITFHSLEDRIVKRYFASLLKGCTCPPDFPVCVCGNKPLGVLPFKALMPDERQKADNPRSRSAVLRVIEKL